MLVCTLRGESMKSRKICENGVIRDMTTEEIAEYEALAQDAPVQPPTAEERLEALESVVLEILGVKTDG